MYWFILLGFCLGAMSQRAKFLNSIRKGKKDE